MFIRPLLFCGLFCFSLNALAQDQTAMQIVQNVQSSLVEVRAVSTKTFATGTATYHSQGSGVILDSYGTIVTNTHIIANAPHIYVGLSDGTILEAQIVHSSDADFSFIKVTPPYPLTPIIWADSSQAQIGTPIVTLSNDNGDQEHVLSGAITDVINNVDTNNVDAFELNLNLFHGDSGGPVLDDEGRLLGIIMGKKLSEDNKSYAISSSKIQQEYQDYQQNLK